MKTAADSAAPALEIGLLDPEKADVVTPIGSPGFYFPLNVAFTSAMTRARSGSISGTFEAEKSDFLSMLDFASSVTCCCVDVCVIDTSGSNPGRVASSLRGKPKNTMARVGLADMKMPVCMKCKVTKQWLRKA